MNDYLLRCGLDDFDCLNLYSRIIEPPTADWSRGFSIAYWFWAADQVRQQDMVRNLAPDHTWTIAICDGAVTVHGMPDDKPLSLALRGAGWHHVTLTVKRDGEVQVWLRHRQNVDSHKMQNSMAGSSPGQLLVGGSTDPAGGHYDHTFGRRGSGLIDDFRLFGRALTEQELTAFAIEVQPALQAAIHMTTSSNTAPLDVDFEAIMTHESAERIAAYLWDLGDGTRTTSRSLTHRYEYAGQYKVRLRVIDHAHEQAVAEQILRIGGQENPLCFSPVFINGSEGYACYRIPSIVRALNGDLVAFAEARLESCSDSTGTIHIVCKRSADHGLTWSPLRVIAAVDGFVNMNASPVVDEVHGTGKVIVVFRAADHSEWDIARGIGLSRAMYVSSEDHGLTWSHPRDITAFVHRPYQPSYAAICPAAEMPENQQHDWRIQIPAQGHAIQLKRTPQTRGRLFFAGSLTRGDRSIFESENYVFWSDDLGETWQIGGIIPRIGLNEAIAAELNNGDVIINTRAYTNQKSDGRRAVTRARFDDKGVVNFEQTIHDEALIDPAVQATLLRYTWGDQQEYGSKSRLLFANPAHPLARVNLTVRLSYDDGQTWAFSKVVERGAASYSDLVITVTHEIGLLYERGNTGGITFVRFTLDWLTGGQDQI